MKRIVVVVLLFVVGSIAGCATTAPVPQQRHSASLPEASEPQIYRLHSGNLTISGFRVMPDGSLMHLGQTPTTLPVGANGLVAR